MKIAGNDAISRLVTEIKKKVDSPKLIASGSSGYMFKIGEFRIAFESIQNVTSNGKTFNFAQPFNDVIVVLAYTYSGDYVPLASGGYSTSSVTIKTNSSTGVPVNVVAIGR